MILCSVRAARLGSTSLVDIARNGDQWPVFLYIAAQFESAAVDSAPTADGMLIKPFSAHEVEDLVWRTIVVRGRAEDPGAETG